MLIQVEKGSTTTTMLRLYIASRDWLLKHTYYYDDETDDWVHHTRMMVGDVKRLRYSEPKKRVYKAHKLLWIYFISFKNLIDANEKSQEKYMNTVGDISIKKEYGVMFPNNVDLELLETMFNERSYHPNGINFEKYKSDVIDECYMVCPNNTRFDECSLLHKAGNHVVKGIIKKKTDTRKLLIGSMIKSYLNEKAISDLHPSLTHNTHFGQTILGVAYEFMKHEIHMHDQFVFLIMGSILFYQYHKKLLIFTRIFTNIGTTNQNLTKNNPRLQNLFILYRLGCIIADQHKGQAFLNSKYSHLSQLNTYNIFNKNETLIRTDNYPEILFMNCRLGER
ncbi:unnamed protein product [Rhizophagus irregularis]|nr:unnamed protein product [Rhizophagus irregularis]